MPHPSRSSRALARLALGLAIGPCLSGCGAGDEDERLNVLMVVIDTARADKFGSYGHSGGLTPRMDELAAQGATFERAVAHAPWTLPSTASLLSSLHPQEHGAGGFLDLEKLERGDSSGIGFRPLPDSVQTVTESFRASGWRTGAIVNVDFLDEGFGLTQGIDDLDARWYESNQEVRSATQTTDKALDWLDDHADEPFFLLTHYFDAHAVYSPPEEYRQRFAAPQDQTDSNFVFGTRAHMLMLRAGKLALDPDLIRRAELLYEAELAYVDAEVGRLLDGVAERGLSDDTLVVLTADHGEEFLDHGGFEHGHSLYDELISVPLIFRLPGLVRPGVRPAGTAALVDVAPTLCELAGVPTPEAFVGRSLTSALRGEQLAERPVLAHGNFWGQPLASWESAGFKLILSPGGDGQELVELFDMQQDPGEERNLAGERPELLKKLRDEYEAVREHLARRAESGEVQLSDELRDRLQALGYLGGAPVGEEDEE